MTQNTDTPRRLSPWNPLDHLRLLWWMLVMPQQLVDYREVYGVEDEIRVRGWLINTLAWLPLFLLALARGLKTLPQESMLPSTYLWVSAGLVPIWILTGWLVQKKSPLGSIVSLVVGFVLKFSMASIVGIFVSLILLFMANTISSSPGISNAVQHSIVYGVIVLATCLVTFPLPERYVVSSVKNSLKTGQPSWLLRGAFVILVLAHICFVWFGFLGGWRVFR